MSSFFAWIKIIFPTDSYGNICGRGTLEDRPVLLFFDITKCLNLAVLATGCITPQACVKKCPEETFSGQALALDGHNDKAKEGMRDFCYAMTDKDWNSKTAKQLIKEGYCPAWVLPSQPYLGRCMPLGVASNATQNNTSSRYD